MPDEFEGCKVVFPQYRRGRAGIPAFDGTILDHARKLGIEIQVECGGKGTCGRCVVRIAAGAEFLNPLSEAEARSSLGQSERLACQARISRPGNVTVYVRNAGAYSILSESLHREIGLDPLVCATNGQVVWTGCEPPRVLSHRPEDGLYGLAVDVGTTTVVCQLLDLQTGQEVATSAARNPQAAYGDDVISRIGHAMYNDDGLAELQRVILKAVNERLADLRTPRGIPADAIYEAVIVGNPTMRNIFFHLDVRSLGVLPFEPTAPEALNVSAADLGLNLNPRANVYGAALIGGHAGADCLADVMSCGQYEAERPCLVIDIGTNGEVAIGNRDRIMTASCAAGGAYEGATVGCGVGAIEGAIKSLWFENGDVRYATIGDKPPIGVCGSGLIDLLAELLRAGIMDRRAKIREDFVIAPNIRLTQQDIHQLITAKGGLRTDQDLLIRYYGVELADLEAVYLAGAFANYINVDNAIEIGLLPDASDKVRKIGNGALAGAREMLLSRHLRETSEAVARAIEHVKPNELEPDFAFLVADHMYF